MGGPVRAEEERNRYYGFSRNNVDALLAARKAKFFATKKNKPEEAVEAVKVHAMPIAYREASEVFSPRVCGLCGAWVIDDLAHTGWHNNLTLGVQVYANEEHHLSSISREALRSQLRAQQEGNRK
jgi:hypothetical protein